MNYTQQFNKQYSRIWSLIHPNENELVGFCLPVRDRHGKDDWADFTFYAKDFWTFSDFRQVEFLVEVFTAKNEKGEWTLEEGSLRIVNYKHCPENLRDLFLANCLPSNDPEQDKIKIENLKLINW